MRRLLLLPLCLLPGLAFAEPAQLRIQGSNTIGATLAPALVRGLLQAQGASAIESLSGAAANETVMRAHARDGQPMRIEIAAHGSSTGFTALADGEADLAAASRPISDREVQQLQALGNLRSADSEQVIGLDGVAVIVHPDNPLPQLSTAQLAQVFSGQIQRWEQLGVPGGAIHLYARDDRSGTFETFRALVLEPQHSQLSGQARRFESADALAAQVKADRQAIGFSGLATLHGAKALAVAEGDAPALPPSRALIASEDYPLSRRLFFYLPAAATRQARALAEFAQSPAGQAIVARHGFVSQQIKALPVMVQADMPPRYRTLASEAHRLSVNFRFQEGSASLDNKALRDVQRVGAYLRQAGKLQSKAVLVGFGDPKETPGRAALLSRLRAMAVRRELAREGVEFKDVTGMGDELPVADNDQQQGRLRNRRVEVWVY
ncbi:MULTISPECIES: phosphate ABC transporter substrate-binding/OmpA family protein [unclassified Pseudomonas]|uniref:phosphate ABC transporter substrate-binding/OmpA family protein n=1 Tax=unclassified Pseudomonas TaxID=196821 RepID=UPI002448C926|nr:MULTISPECIES: phosphate ABC transporter substrate-binding/OmpA family protein [unclassified Pseudomonas]MDH0300893.1 phosphate ABC transporter substrate-binding/OmpA family protein [Pseudomonas sp. GD04091]MDH1985198.1 phosphate ABC transporter substrate-binding/OmpA family protein [Pseudomonas sp. GD03689]